MPDVIDATAYFIVRPFSCCAFRPKSGGRADLESERPESIGWLSRKPVTETSISLLERGNTHAGGRGCFRDLNPLAPFPSRLSFCPGMPDHQAVAGELIQRFWMALRLKA